MGLSASVGVYTLFPDDPGFLSECRRTLDDTSAFLRAASLPDHREPLHLPPERCLSLSLPGYSGLQLLRRFAALLRAGQSPQPLRPPFRAARDPLLLDYYGQCDWTVGPKGFSLFTSDSSSSLRFDHLVFHADSFGVYVPREFQPVLLTWKDGDEFTQAVGSSNVLVRECDQLADSLGIPPLMDPDSRELQDAAATPAGTGPSWKRFGVEALTCVQLRAAAVRSVETGAAIVFH